MSSIALPAHTWHIMLQTPPAHLGIFGGARTTADAGCSAAAAAGAGAGAGAGARTGATAGCSTAFGACCFAGCCRRAKAGPCAVYTSPEPCQPPSRAATNSSKSIRHSHPSLPLTAALMLAAPPPQCRPVLAGAARPAAWDAMAAPVEAVLPPCLLCPTGAATAGMAPCNRCS